MGAAVGLISYSDAMFLYIIILSTHACSYHMHACIAIANSYVYVYTFWIAIAI